MGEKDRLEPDAESLLELTRIKMPFGKYKGEAFD